MSESAAPEPIEEILPKESAIEEKPKTGRAKKDKVKKERTKKGRGKTFVVLAVILLIGGGFAGAAAMGLIPGLKLPGRQLAKKTPDPSPSGQEKAPKPAAAAAKPEPAKRPLREATPEPEPEKKKAAAPTIDPDKGAKAIARIWEKMEPEKLVEIAASYKDIELARVMSGMETKKAAALLTLLPAQRAGKLSQEMERQASMISPQPGT